MAWLVWQRFPRLGPLWFLMATPISWSRVQSHAHCPYQVFVGALHGSGLSLLILSRQTGVLVPRILWSDRQARCAFNKTAFNQAESGEETN
ncbi:hypothetical protein B1R32_12138 [Abditibacterium utsteinense]|uniref:PAP2 superfamily protein n=1 Tax=Abditibacterium utsteinense TaxID=1960156 RepID=A0A2S8SPX4_9BACT|nr:hypothetical protein B1R32_12138 [Abditibacterium utsteinense]